MDLDVLHIFGSTNTIQSSTKDFNLKSIFSEIVKFSFVFPFYINLRLLFCEFFQKQQNLSTAVALKKSILQMRNTKIINLRPYSHETQYRDKKILR